MLGRRRKRDDANVYLACLTLARVIGWNGRGAQFSSRGGHKVTPQLIKLVQVQQTVQVWRMYCTHTI